MTTPPPLIWPHAWRPTTPPYQTLTTEPLVSDTHTPETETTP